MAWNVLGSGPFDKASVSGNPSLGIYPYDFFSGEITTTDNFPDNAMTFGFISGEVLITNLGSNPIAYQFPRLSGTNKASGVVPANSHVSLRGARIGGISVKSLNAGLSASCSVAAT